MKEENFRLIDCYRDLWEKQDQEVRPQPKVQKRLKSESGEKGIKWVISQEGKTESWLRTFTTK